jgi:hypothetical protein
MIYTATTALRLLVGHRHAAHGRGDYTTKLPLEDLLNGLDRAPLPRRGPGPEHVADQVRHAALELQAGRR